MSRRGERGDISQAHEENGRGDPASDHKPWCALEAIAIQHCEEDAAIATLTYEKVLQAGFGSTLEL